MNDPTIGENIESITTDVASFVKTAFGLQTYVGIRTEYNFQSAFFKTYFSLELQPRADKYYLVEIVDDPRGNPEDTLIFNAGGWGGSDQQGYSATYSGNIVQEVRNGKIIGHVKDAALQFRTREFWKSMDAIGDASTVHVTGLRQYKGDPYQRFNQTISAPAARFRNVNVINTGRNL